MLHIIMPGQLKYFANPTILLFIYASGFSIEYLTPVLVLYRLL